MYKALNRFLEEDSWDSYNWPDMDRFYRGLNEIIRQPGFSTASMKQYIDEFNKQKGRAGGGKSDEMVDHLVNAAQTVQNYHQLAATDTVQHYLKATSGV